MFEYNKLFDENQERSAQDFCKRVSSKADKKAKVGDSRAIVPYFNPLRMVVFESAVLMVSNIHCPTLTQKLAQLDEEGHIHLHDIVCLWVWLKERLQRAFPSDTVDRYTEYFHKGNLDMILKHMP